MRLTENVDTLTTKSLESPLLDVSLIAMVENVLPSEGVEP